MTNAYITKHARTRPQISQRSFDIRLPDGSKRSVHGVKGANGEWMLEAFTGGWVRLGIAMKANGGWTCYTESGTFTGRTLTSTITTALEGAPA